MRKPRIAVLDVSVLESLRFTLQSYSEINVFSGEAELLWVAKKEDYDCILVRSSLGHHLQLRLSEARVTTPVIYVASEGSVSEAVAAIKLGAVDYLCRPVEIGELLAAIDAALRQKRTGIPDRFWTSDVELDHVVDTIEREFICSALKRSNGVVGGRSGAAALLGVTRTGLLYKMKRLGISRTTVEVEDSEPENIEIGDESFQPTAVGAS